MKIAKEELERGLSEYVGKEKERRENGRTGDQMPRSSGSVKRMANRVPFLHTHVNERLWYANPRYP